MKFFRKGNLETACYADDFCEKIIAGHRLFSCPERRMICRF